MTAMNYEKALELLAQDPPREAINRSPKGDKYLKIGDVRAVMGKAFGLSYSSRISFVRLEVTEQPDVDKRTGEIKEMRWGAYAVAHCEVAIGAPGMPACVRSDVGTGDAQRAKSPGDAVGVATKGAASDAFKRACYSLGKRVGLGLRLDKRVDYEEAPAAEGVDEHSGADYLRSDPEAVVAEARWGLSAELSEPARVAIASGEHPGMGDGAELLPGDPGPGELLGIKLAHEALDELAQWPAGDPLDRPLLREIYSAAAEAAGDEETRRIFSELGVELREGAFVSGYAARLFVAAAAVVAQARESVRS